jgi:hypothetical protein
LAANEARQGLGVEGPLSFLLRSLFSSRRGSRGGGSRGRGRWVRRQGRWWDATPREDGDGAVLGRAA